MMKCRLHSNKSSFSIALVLRQWDLSKWFWSNWPLACSPYSHAERWILGKVADQILHSGLDHFAAPSELDWRPWAGAEWGNKRESVSNAFRLNLHCMVWVVFMCTVNSSLKIKIKSYSSAKITTTTGHYLLSLGITDNMCTHNTQAVKYLRAMSWFFELAFSYNQQMAEKRIAVNKIRR